GRLLGDEVRRQRVVEEVGQHGGVVVGDAGSALIVAEAAPGAPCPALIRARPKTTILVDGWGSATRALTHHEPTSDRPGVLPRGRPGADRPARGPAAQPGPLDLAGHRLAL